MATAEKRSLQHTPERLGLAPLGKRLESMPSRLMERLDRLLGDWDPMLQPLRSPEETLLRAPAMDVYEDGSDIVVETELPGMKKEEVEVKLAGDLLTISARHQAERKVERKDYYRAERSASALTRTLRLPVEVQAERMTAELKDGVLQIRAPKAESAKAAGRVVPVT